MPCVIIENSDMPPMPAMTLSGMNTTDRTVNRLINWFMLLFTMLPRASLRPVRMLE